MEQRGRPQGGAASIIRQGWAAPARCCTASVPVSIWKKNQPSKHPPAYSCSLCSDVQTYPGPQHGHLCTRAVAGSGSSSPKSQLCTASHFCLHRAGTLPEVSGALLAGRMGAARSGCAAGLPAREMPNLVIISVSASPTHSDIWEQTALTGPLQLPVSGSAPHACP